MRWFRSNKSDFSKGSPGGGMGLAELVASQIKSLGTLDGPHYVFLVTMNTGDQMVLKAEMQIGKKELGASHDLGVRIMGLVSPVRAQTLNDREVQQINLISDGITMDFFRAEKMVEKGEAKWVKAAFQKGLVGMASSQNYTERSVVSGAITFTVDEAAKAKMKSRMAKLQVQLLGHTKAWRSLGRILAVDMLLGNYDRLDVSTGEIANWGNLQFREVNGKITEAVGLDTFDAGKVTSSDLYGGDFDSWREDFGKFLQKPELALPKMVTMMDWANRRVLKDFGEQGAWGPKEAKALHDGFVQGIRDLKGKMKVLGKQLLSSKGSAPSELIRRLNFLGWLG